MMLKAQKSKQAVRPQKNELVKKAYTYEIGDPCFAFYFAPRRNKDPRWIPAFFAKKRGTRSVHVIVIPKGPVWRHHIDKLRPRYATIKDEDPGEVSSWEKTLDIEVCYNVNGERGCVYLPRWWRRSSWKQLQL